MRCGEIRNSSCGAEIRPEYKFCPACGSVTARVHPESNVRFLVPPDRTTRRFVSLKYVGLPGGTATVHVECLAGTGTTPALRLIDTDKVLSADGRIDLEIDGRLLGSAVEDCALELRVSDSERNDETRWCLEPARMQRLAIVKLQLGLLTGASVEVVPNNLVFAAGSKEREIVLRNRGDVGVKVMNVQAPPGFAAHALEQDPDRLLVPGHESHYRITREDVAPDADAKLRVFGLIQDEGGSEEVTLLAEAGVFVFPVRTVMPQARFVVGIDFGTSNTSVVLRDTGADDYVTFLPGRPPLGERWPTVISIPKDGNRAQWRFAHHAEDAYESDPKQTVMIDELKSCLRTAEEPWAPFGVQVDDLLAWYLGKLRTDLVEPEVEARSEGVVYPVHYVFSLPVLDGRGGRLFELQKRRMKRAIAMAGFGDPDDPSKFSFPTEPECAAYYFLQKEKDPEKQLGFEGGDHLLVFDSGGGTTDIALCQVRAEEGSVSFEPAIRQVGSYSEEGHRDKCLQFGGTVVSKGLGRLCYEEYATASEVTLNVFVNQIAQLEKLPAKSVAFSQNSADPWHRRLRKTYQLFNGAKLKLSRCDADSEIPSTAGVFPEDAGLAAIEVSLAQLHTIVDGGMSEIMGAMEDMVFVDGVTPAVVRYVFAVGGNCNLPRITEHWLRNLFGVRQLVSVTAEDRSLAVAGGTVFSYNATFAAIPYDLEVRPEGPEGTTEVGATTFSSQSRLEYRPQFVGLPFASGVGTFSVWARWNAHECRLATVRYKVADPRYVPAMRANVVGGRLVVSAVEAGRESPVLDYEV